MYLFQNVVSYSQGIIETKVNREANTGLKLQKCDFSNQYITII